MKYEIREVAPTPTPREVVLTCTPDEFQMLEVAVYCYANDVNYLSDDEKWNALRESVHETLQKARITL